MCLDIFQICIKIYIRKAVLNRLSSIFPSLIGNFKFSTDILDITKQGPILNLHYVYIVEASLGTILQTFNSDQTFSRSGSTLLIGSPSHILAPRPGVPSNRELRCRECIP